MDRISVPNRRTSELHSFMHNGIMFQGQVSWIEGDQPDQWRPVEMFLEGGKNGTAIQAVARDTAVAASLALQFGTPIDTLRHALTRNDDGTPAGPLGALLDLISGGAPSRG
ncbi:hypothetical protein [Aestuariivirga litoralis]|uniref:hypothetical protein n=1 Tax=Aestuariivirga litoralis TaxID=2650924 RepID=UPI0018C7F797|nr:hypothetical protein [Aestuariivirga litoralis]MBG1233005.1 hypothetical protein [Aestuariivirga litoralis]